MYILALDTTAKTVSVCLAKNENGNVSPLVRYTSNCGFTHSETLLPMIDNCLSAAGVTPCELSVLAASAGPGSFTGVRIGVACLKGISFSLSSKGIAHKCVGVSSLEALALNVSQQKGYILCPVMDARRSQFYNALFKAGGMKRLCEDRLLTASELYDDLCKNATNKKVLLVGDGANLCSKLFDEIAEKKNEEAFKYTVCDSAYMYQDAYSCAKLAAKLVEKNDKSVLCSAKELSPVYLRASQAERERLARESKQI